MIEIKNCNSRAKDELKQKELFVCFVLKHFPKASLGTE